MKQLVIVALLAVTVAACTSDTTETEVDLNEALTYRGNKAPTVKNGVLSGAPLFAVVPLSDFEGADVAAISARVVDCPNSQVIVSVLRNGAQLALLTPSDGQGHAQTITANVPVHVDADTVLVVESSGLTVCSQQVRRVTLTFKAD